MNANKKSPRYGRVEDLLDLPALAVRRVTEIGLGSMGQPVGAQFARHGVGTKSPGRIRLIDGDVVEHRNLIGTDYRLCHVDLQKARATADIIKEIDPDVNVSFWDHMVTSHDVPKIVELARQSDLLCLFADSFDLMLEIANACDRICPQVMAVFGPRCDYAEVAFSVPDRTIPLSTTLGRRKRQAISKPQALGCDTGYVANFVTALCLRLLVGGARGKDLLPCFANTPLHILGLRPSWIFSQQPPELVRAIYRVAAPINWKSH